MRVVILLDRSFARREREMLSRLEIGLADEGVRIVHAVPRSILQSESVGIYSSAVGYDDRPFPTTDHARVRQLANAISDLPESDLAGSVDLVHCFAPGRARLATELAAALGACALIEVWDVASAHSAADARRRAKVPTRLAFPDKALRDIAAKGLSDGMADVCPWGVHASDVSTHTRASDQAPSVGLLVDCSHPLLLEPAMQGLSQAAAALPELLVFVDTERAKSAMLWKMARKHGLLDRLSIVPGVEARREPILHMDAIVIPEPSGRFRSLTLDAMARGVPIVASPDPAISVLSNPAIARLVPTRDSATWCQALVKVLSDEADRSSLATAARAFVRAERSASAHVASVLRVYESAITRQSSGTAA